MNHFTININERDGICQTCGNRTALIVSDLNWSVDSDSENLPDFVEVGEELTGHWCFKCERLTSISFNRGTA